MPRGSARWTEADLLLVEQRRESGANAQPRVSRHEPGGILGLDLSSVSGYAYGGIEDAAPLCGTWVLPETPPGVFGPRYAAFENELIDALNRWRPALVMVEAPMRLYAQTKKRGTEAAARQQYGLHAYAEGECARAKVRIGEVDVTEARDRTIGRRRWQVAGTDTKQNVVSWCFARGWAPADHNAADACVIWQYACDRERAKLRRARARSV